MKSQITKTNLLNKSGLTQIINILLSFIFTLMFVLVGVKVSFAGNIPCFSEQNHSGQNIQDSMAVKDRTFTQFSITSV